MLQVFLFEHFLPEYRNQAQHFHLYLCLLPLHFLPLKLYIHFRLLQLRQHLLHPLLPLLPLCPFHLWHLLPLWLLLLLLVPWLLWLLLRDL